MNAQKLFALSRTTYGWLVAIASRLQSPLLLGVRLYWGWEFFQTGWGKLTNLDRTAEFFATLQIPFPTLNAVMAGAAECFGGLLLLAGLASRLTAIPLIVTMIVAYLTADNEAVQSIFADPDKFVTATPFLFLFAALLVFVFGPGVFSLDWLLARKFAAPAPTAAHPPVTTFVHEPPRVIAK